MNTLLENARISTGMRQWVWSAAVLLFGICNLTASPSCNEITQFIPSRGERSILQVAGLPRIITKILSNQELQRCASPTRAAYSLPVGGFNAEG
jgi:hypothetical protein